MAAMTSHEKNDLFQIQVLVISRKPNNLETWLYYEYSHVLLRDRIQSFLSRNLTANQQLFCRSFMSKEKCETTELCLLIYIQKKQVGQ